MYLCWGEKTWSEKPRLKIFMYMLPLFKWVVLYSLPDAWSGLQATFCPATHLYFQQYTLVFQTKSTKYKMEKSTNADKRGYLLMKQFIKIFKNGNVSRWHLTVERETYLRTTWAPKTNESHFHFCGSYVRDDNLEEDPN